MGKSQKKKKGERKENVGRRRHVEEGEFFKQLEKMYSLSRAEGDGDVTISISKMPEAYAMKHAVQEGKPLTGKKAKEAKAKAEANPTPPVPKAIVRGKRKGVTVSTLIPATDVLRFQASLADCMRSNIDTLKKIKKPKKKAPTQGVKPKELKKRAKD